MTPTTTPYQLTAWIATNATTGITNLYDGMPSRLPGGDFLGRILITLGVKGLRPEDDQHANWGTKGMPFPNPGSDPQRVILKLEIL